LSLDEEGRRPTVPIPDSSEPALALCLFGPFEARVNGAPLPRLRSRKGVWLLALLALRRGRAVERDWLADTLWPESTPAQLSHNLSVSLTDLRRALGPEAGRLHTPRRHTLCLDLTDAAVDVLAFDAAIARGNSTSLEQAVSLYRGPLLEGCSEEWAFQERQAREQAYLTAREALATHALSRGEPAEAERHLRSVIAVDPLREKAQRTLMELLAAGGNVAAALQIYRKLRLRLQRELKVEPDAETQALFQKLRGEATAAATDHRRQLQEVSSTHSRHSSVRHLPLQLSSFIGRQAEKAEVQQQLADHRLVTLTGAGGCGKTRLALETATGLLVAFPAGIWFIELAALADPGLLPQTVASALGIKEQPDRPVTQTLVEALQPKRLLLLLDNCEHLVAACAELAETLLQRCPQLRILATSREPLGIAGEQPYRVPSLSLPGVQAFGRSGVQEGLPDPPEGLLQSEAVRLFVERAVAAQPAFALTEENAVAVAQICCRLDGIPLAIELAAARLKALPLETLSQRLDDMFGLLTGGRRTALPRHQTLRALIDWSYDLLTPPEQTLLGRLSVFAGGYTLEAVEEVCSDVDPQSHTDEHRRTGPSSLSATVSRCGSSLQKEPMIDLLARLVEKSLVLYEEREGEGRYRLLEMIREYAQGRLIRSGESQRLQERHSRFFLALAEATAPELTRRDQRFWLDLLEREHDNFRAALARSIESGELEIALRLGSALEGFWRSRGHVREGRNQLLRILAESGAAAPTATRARALSAAGVLTSLHGTLDDARALYDESLAIWRRLEDRAEIAAVLRRMAGMAAVNQWDPATARPLVEESLAVSRELGDRRAIADALTILARVRKLEGDPAAERALLEESLALWRELDDRIRIIRGLESLGFAALERQDFDSAHRAFKESLTAARELDDKIGIAWALTNLGHLTRQQGDFPAARAFLEQSVLLWRELDDQLGLIETLGFLGVTHWQQRDLPAAYAVFEETLAMAREANWTGFVSQWLNMLGHTAGDLGRWEEAAAHCGESLRLARSGDNDTHRLHTTWSLTGLARAALARGRPARAARLLGATEALWAASITALLRPGFERTATGARAQLGAAEYEVAWAAGQAMTREQVIAEALEEAPAG
jgi:predicted ATPase/DNA-binding SARP family transcriptional activator